MAGLIVVSFGGCADDDSSARREGDNTEGYAQVRIEQVDQRTGTFVEGSIWFVVLESGAFDVFRGRFALGATRDVTISVYAREREYHLVTYDRVCGGHCDRLGEPVDRCETTFRLNAGETHVRTVITEEGCDARLVKP